MSIRENIDDIVKRIENTCKKVGRNPNDITVIAVSKTVESERAREAVEAGINNLGENRVQELVEKYEQLPKEIKWHLIGHLQSRKARDLFTEDGQPLFDLMHSVDSVKLAGKLSRLAEDHGAKLEILLQVNVSGEASKEGFDAVGWDQDKEIRARLWQDFSTIRSMPGLAISGLMTIAPIVDEMEQARPVFRSLRLLRDALSESFGAILPDLSMGMTDDYPVAVEEGSTLVRVGRAIFGEREYPQ